VAIPLDIDTPGDLTAETPFADLRVVSDRKEEIPWQIVSKRPETRQETIAFRMKNLSTTENGDTWVEFLVDEQEPGVNALQIVTPETDYMRQVEVLGSQDGRTWQSLRKDGIIFEMEKGEKLQNDRISFPETSFPHLAIRISNSGKNPLKITEVRLLRQKNAVGEIFMIKAAVGKPEFDESKKESRIIVSMDKRFPVDRLLIFTKETNFQRFVTVESKNGKGEWQTVAGGTVFSFDSPDLHSSQLVIEMPESSSREYRLVFRNHDSPPLIISNVFGEGYRRVLVFKTYPDRKLFLFWGNPSALHPHYDLAAAVTAETVEKLPAASLGEVLQNPSFAGERARQPFTERYRVLLYVVVTLAIAVLFLMQYRVFKRIHPEDKKPQS
jgi:hypothetical protein